MANRRRRRKSQPTQRAESPEAAAPSAGELSQPATDRESVADGQHEQTAQQESSAEHRSTEGADSSAAATGASERADSRTDRRRQVGAAGDTSTAAASASRPWPPVGDSEGATRSGWETRFPRLPSLSRVMSVVMLMIGIVAIGALFYKVMAGFFVPLFLATLLVVIFRPVHEWIFVRVGKRPRIAALTTTTLIMLLVLLPVIMVLSVATSQFTAMVGQADLNDLSGALDRVRQQLSISLEKPEQFRRLDRLADAFDEPDDPALVLANIAEARQLVEYLQREVAGPAEAEAAAAIAEQRLSEFADAVRVHMAEDRSRDTIGEITAEEQFHKQSVIATAAIRTWMRTLLGGTVMSQAKLLANPSEADFAALLRAGREALQPRFFQATSATGAFLMQTVVGLLILVVAVYFFLLDGPVMVRTLMRLSPMDDNYERRLLLEFDRTSRAVVLASVMSALVQGVLAATAYWIIGFDSVIFLFLLTTIMALIPFLGAASVWVPCAIWLAAVEQRWTAAIFLAIYGAAVVSSIDNVIKVYVLHGRSTLHPLFALLSVFGGVKVFGPIGVLIGPMVVVFLQTLLEILNHELISTDTDKAQDAKAKTQTVVTQPG